MSAAPSLPKIPKDVFETYQKAAIALSTAIELNESHRRQADDALFKVQANYRAAKAKFEEYLIGGTK